MYVLRICRTGYHIMEHSSHADKTAENLAEAYWNEFRIPVISKTVKDGKTIYEYANPRTGNWEFSIIVVDDLPGTEHLIEED